MRYSSLYVTLIVRPSCTISPEPYIWLSFMVHMCKMIIFTDFFFFLFFIFWILFFWVVRKGKRAKNSLKWKIKIISVRHLKWKKVLSAALHISERKLYTMWLSFMEHMCKMTIPPGIFFNFSKFWYYGYQGGRGVVKREKNSQKWQKNSVCRTLYFRNHISYDLHL